MFTRLDDLKDNQILVFLAHETVELLIFWKRAPYASELILISSEQVMYSKLASRPLPFGLKVIGAIPGFGWCHSVAIRSDCGPFWSAIAHLKYWNYCFAINGWYKFLKLFALSGMLRAKTTYELSWDSIHWDAILLTAWLTIIISVIYLACSFSTNSWVINTLLGLITTNNILLSRIRSHQLLEEWMAQESHAQSNQQ